MDTKLKKFNNNILVKILAFGLCVILGVTALIGGLVIAFGFEQTGRNFTLDEIWSSKSYLESSELQDEFREQSATLQDLICYYKSEENIKQGNLLKDTQGTDFAQAVDTLYYEGHYSVGAEEIEAKSFTLANGITVHFDDGPVVNQEDFDKINGSNIEYDGAVEDSVAEYSEEGQYLYTNLSINDAQVRAAFKEANKEGLNTIKNALIKDQLRLFNKLKGEMDEEAGISYFATDGTNIITNIANNKTPQSGSENTQGIEQQTEGSSNANVIANTVKIPNKSEFRSNPAYMIYEDGELEKAPKSENSTSSWARNTDRAIEDQLFSEYNDDLKMYISFNQEYIDARQELYQNTSGITGLIPWVALSATGCLLLFLYLLITTGSKDEDGKIKLYSIDRIWTEVQLIFIGAALLGGALLVSAMLYSLFMVNGGSSADVIYMSSGNVVESIGIIGSRYNSNLVSMGAFSTPGMITFILGMILCAAVGLWFILSVVRLLKAKCFIKTSLIYKLWHLIVGEIVGKCCKTVWRKVKELYSGSSLMKKIIILLLGISLVSATIFLAPIVILLILVFAPKYIKRFEEIKNGVEEVKNGNLTYEIPVYGDGELDKLAANINSISQASNVAVQNELKNQRMKTDLISNVSHDLKTPLTSMVTYIDLLKTEGLDSENAAEYLRILDEKTERLRHLTEDLFEAAKASSGAMPVHMERVELLSLINQGLGEMDQKIKASGLEFIINAENEKYYVMADGQLLWRVVENLLGNVLKYALENSRVYIDIKQRKTTTVREDNKKAKKSTVAMVTLEMKNISRNPLNIKADELMERFKRGDESRTTEGSGLGLAIAKDLVKLQSGWFEVFIDGDLFKAQVMLEEAEDKEDKEDKEQKDEKAENQ